jgi:hypothetical protein
MDKEKIMKTKITRRSFLIFFGLLSFAPNALIKIFSRLSSENNKELDISTVQSFNCFKKGDFIRFSGTKYDDVLHIVTKINVHDGIMDIRPATFFERNFLSNKDRIADWWRKSAII